MGLGCETISNGGFNSSLGVKSGLRSLVDMMFEIKNTIIYHRLSLFVYVYVRFVP